MNSQKRACIIPGSFDPFTNGHLDIVKRSVKLFDLVIIAIGKNEKKNYLFSELTRKQQIKKVIDYYGFETVKVEIFNGLLVDFYSKKQQEVGACAVIKGVRNEQDYKYELIQSDFNTKKLANFETLFMPCSEQYKHASSTKVKELLAELNQSSKANKACNIEKIANAKKNDSEPSNDILIEQLKNLVPTPLISSLLNKNFQN